MIIKICNIVILSMILINFSSCTSQHSGKIVNMSHPLVCKCQSLPKTCKISSPDFEIVYDIKKMVGNNEYYVEGRAEYQGSATWDSYSKAYFTLLLVKDGIVVETISVAGGKGNLDNTIKFSREFTIQNKFDAVLIGYKMHLRG